MAALKDSWRIYVRMFGCNSDSAEVEHLMTAPTKPKLYVSRVLIPVGILSIWVLSSFGRALAEPGPAAVPPSPVTIPSSPVTTSPSHSMQSSGVMPDSRALAEAILQQGVMLNAASSVTDSLLIQHERRDQLQERKTPPRRRVKRNMSLDVPTIVAVLAVIGGAMWFCAILARRRRKAVVGRKLAEECQPRHPFGAARALKTVAVHVSIQSENRTEDGEQHQIDNELWTCNGRDREAMPVKATGGHGAK